MSFASLKKASSAGNTFARLTKEIEKLNQPQAGSGADERLWKPELDKSGNGYAVIRFIPAPGTAFRKGLVPCIQRTWWSVVY